MDAKDIALIKALGGGGSGGSIGVQSDWNQNDDTQPDYVKNRPFYTGDPVETVVVEESTVTFEDTDGLYAAVFLSTFEVTVGDTYKVTWDGTVYECTCVDLNGILVLGNLSIAGVGSDTGEPFIMAIENGEAIQILTTDTSVSHTFSISTIVPLVVKIADKYLPDNLLLFKPAGKSYLMFSSPNKFTLKVHDSTKHWDGTIEYFASDKMWTVWDGSTALSAVAADGEYVLYLRGTGNTCITGDSTSYSWDLTGTDIKCIGNIENLLDYATVASGKHPTMANKCYQHMFQDCTSLTHAPDLPATTLANDCYFCMFYNCTSLTHAPDLPATTLANDCYYSMFHNCQSLTHAPDLPATTLANGCYCYMFDGCIRLTHAPALPATTLANGCYSGMFHNCQSLTHAPDLPATALTNGCYYYMFKDCTSLTHAPALPATTLANDCYWLMFNNCWSLTNVPALPATTLANRCYKGMFYGCRRLKLSTTQSDEYTQEYRIPSSGEGVTVTDALVDMFTSTGGAFKGTPEINATYYLSSGNMIVRETDIATLNGYVGSMIAKIPQDDWNQNDATQPDYIKNRPFWSSGVKEAAIFESQALTDAGSGHYMYAAQSDSIPEDWPTIAVGDEAKVVIDGVAYNSTLSTYQQEGNFICGNTAFFGGEDTGDPYVLIVGKVGTSYSIQLIYSADTEGETHTASAYVVHEDIQKLDEKYLRGTLLPDNAARGNFVVRGLSSWILCDNPTKLQLIESKNAEFGTSEVRFTIDKIYTKLFLVVSNFHVSGTIDKDIEASVLLGTYYALGSMKKAATAKNGKDVISFMGIERMPYIGYMSTAPAAPIENSSTSETTEMNLVTVRSTAPSFVVEGEHDRSYLCLRITGDTFDRGSSGIVPSVTLYGVLDSDSLR